MLANPTFLAIFSWALGRITIQLRFLLHLINRPKIMLMIWSLVSVTLPLRYVVENGTESQIRDVYEC